MKRVAQIVMGILALAVVAQPAAAQLKRDGYVFLEAVRDRDGDVATQMLSEPGNVLVNARDIGTGETGLHIVTERRDPVWMRFLLNNGADPDAETKKGVTPLQIAAQLGFVEGVEILLDRGADPDVTDASGETPLISAVHRNDTAMVKIMIEKGANPDRADNSGRTARDYAALMGARSQVLAAIEQAEADRGQETQAYGPS